MSKPKSLKTYLGYIACIGWFVASGYVLYYFTFGNYGEFDPEQQWLTVQPTLSLGDLNIDNQEGLTLVHVRAPFCSCNPLADAHKDTIGEHIHQYQRSANEVHHAGFTLPATPAALIFDDDTLIYAGPYASGAFCSVEDSLIEDILSGEQQLAGTYLNGLVRACRCLP
jgi:hypothetical protein